MKIEQIVPIPQQMNYLKTGYFELRSVHTYSAKEVGQVIDEYAKIWLSQYFLLEEKQDVADIVFEKVNSFKTQHYKLMIESELITIEYGDQQGLYYSLLTLSKVIRIYKDRIPTLVIEDWPDIPQRGLLVDVSRGRMPQIKTLFRLVACIAELNYNQLQLYIEGPVFDYKGQQWEGKNREDLLTKEEIKELEIYCTNRNIELIANQNGLGHMQGWLQLDEYHHLSELENEEGCTTLDVTNPESFLFAKELINEISDCYESKYINVNLDEPDELGKGKSKQIVDEKGKHQVYLDYVLAVYEHVHKLGKKMMMWADVIDEYPEILERIPKDIVLLGWGYEFYHDFEKQGLKLSEWGGEFYLCPGTSSWLSFSGRHDNMTQNVDEAIICAKKYGANVMLTDWGDGGHIQEAYVSYPSYIYAGNSMWNQAQSREVDLIGYLNQVLFDDPTLKIGEVIMKLANYYVYEGIRVPNRTLTYNVMAMGYVFGKFHQHMTETALGRLLGEADGKYSIINPMTKGEYDYVKLNHLMQESEKLIKEALPQKDTDVKWELINTLYGMSLGIKLNQYIAYEYHFNQATRENKLLNILEIIDRLRLQHQLIWKERNKAKGIENIVGHLTHLEKIYRLKLEENRKGYFYYQLGYFKGYWLYLGQLRLDYQSGQNRYKKYYKKYLKRRV